MSYCPGPGRDGFGGRGRGWAEKFRSVVFLWKRPNGKMSPTQPHGEDSSVYRAQATPGEPPPRGSIGGSHLGQYPSLVAYEPRTSVPQLPHLYNGIQTYTGLPGFSEVQYLNHGPGAARAQMHCPRCLLLSSLGKAGSIDCMCCL